MIRCAIRVNGVWLSWLSVSGPVHTPHSSIHQPFTIIIFYIFLLLQWSPVCHSEILVYTYIYLHLFMPYIIMLLLFWNFPALLFNIFVIASILGSGKQPITVGYPIFSLLRLDTWLCQGLGIALKYCCNHCLIICVFAHAGSKKLKQELEYHYSYENSYMTQM